MAGVEIAPEASMGKTAMESLLVPKVSSARLETVT
jgi:hypothetical protein